MEVKEIIAGGVGVVGPIETQEAATEPMIASDKIDINGIARKWLDALKSGAISEEERRNIRGAFRSCGKSLTMAAILEEMSNLARREAGTETEPARKLEPLARKG
jgi:hypothetical protein